MGKLFKEGKLTYLWGEPDSGKSNFVFILIYLATLQGKIVACNIYNSLKGVIIIKSDIELLEFFLKYRKDLMVVLDEANLFQSSKNALSTNVKNLEMLLSIIRKLRASFFFVIQRDKNLIPYIREMSYCEIYKEEQTTAKVNIGKDSFMFNNIPSCQEYDISYETYSFSSFSFKLNLEKIFEELNGLSYEDAITRLEKMAFEDWEGYRKDEKKKPRKKSKD